MMGQKPSGPTLSAHCVFKMSLGMENVKADSGGTSLTTQLPLKQAGTIETIRTKTNQAADLCRNVLQPIRDEIGVRANPGFWPDAPRF